MPRWPIREAGLAPGPRRIANDQRWRSDVQGRGHEKSFRGQGARQPSLGDQAAGPAHRSLARALTAAMLGMLVGSQVLVAQELQSRSPQRQDAQTSQLSAEPLPQRETGSDNASSVLLMLGTSPERRQLAAELETLIEQGNFEAAQDRLYTAIEIGSLAVLLTDRLRDPGFLAGLKTLGSRGEERPKPPPAVPQEASGSATDRASPGQPPSHVAELAELKEAKEREQQRADAIARELATANEELHALRALRERDARSATDAAGQLTEWRGAFERERERADAASRELLAAREEHRALQATREQDSALLASSQKELGELKAEIEKERQRNATAAAAIVKQERSPETEIDGPGQASGAAPPSVSAPSTTASIAAPERASPPASLGRLRGVPNVLTPSTLLLQGRRIRLFGVEAAGDVGSTNELTRYLGGREVVCDLAARPDIYRCQVDGKDVSLVVLFNGGGRVTSDGTADLKSAADRARSAGVGIWNRSASSK